MQHKCVQVRRGVGAKKICDFFEAVIFVKGMQLKIHTFSAFSCGKTTPCAENYSFSQRINICTVIYGGLVRPDGQISTLRARHVKCTPLCMSSRSNTPRSEGGTSVAVGSWATGSYIVVLHTWYMPTPCEYQQHGHVP